MAYLDFYKNYLNDVEDEGDDFENLIKAGDVDAAKAKMYSRESFVLPAMKEYDTFSHDVMRREDKLITDKNGNFLRKEKVWKLPVPYPVYINEISLVFLYGSPVKWVQMSTDTDNAFSAFKDVVKRTRFDSKVRQCKRLAGAETESAMLFRVFKDEGGKPDVQIRVLARSKGDEIYTRWDIYENLLSIAWGYYAKNDQGELEYHLDVFTSKTIYHCTHKAMGWQVEEEVNLIGKIPVILFWQDKEWKGVEPLINREEYIASRTADVNDYFADPTEIISADVVKNLPEKKEAGKLLITNDKDGVDKAARYLTWDSAPQSKKDELEWLQNQILSKTFTPNITLDALKSMGNMSGKALRTVMLLADIKASKHKEIHDELLDRTASLITSIIGNVLDISLHDECERLKVQHEYQGPFADDIAEDLENIIKSVDGGIMSTETAVELNPLLKDHTLENERLQKEGEQSARQRQSIFGSADGTEGALSFSV